MQEGRDVHGRSGGSKAGLRLATEDPFLRNARGVPRSGRAPCARRESCRTLTTADPMPLLVRPGTDKVQQLTGMPRRAGTSLR